jgi:hypothetical protein
MAREARPHDLISVVAGEGEHEAVLGHDIGQATTVSGKERAVRWFQQLRQTYAHAITQGVLLVLGHVHELHLSEDKLSWSIPRFAVGAISSTMRSSEGDTAAD